MGEDVMAARRNGKTALVLVFLFLFLLLFTVVNIPELRLEASVLFVITFFTYYFLTKPKKVPKPEKAVLWLVAIAEVVNVYLMFQVPEYFSSGYTLLTIGAVIFLAI